LCLTHAGQVVLRVETAPDTDPDANSAKLQFSVRDTGSGIPLEKQTLIFEAFSLDAGLDPQMGDTLVIANDGRQALEAWAQQDFDLVLMDIQMPEMDGLEATKAIRTQEADRGSHIPIVALTTRAIEGDKEHILAAGMDGLPC
jgi:CheY-like chemotaxis protein